MESFGALEILFFFSCKLEIVSKRKGKHFPKWGGNPSPAVILPLSQGAASWLGVGGAVSVTSCPACRPCPAPGLNVRPEGHTLRVPSCHAPSGFSTC